MVQTNGPAQIFEIGYCQTPVVKNWAQIEALYFSCKSLKTEVAGPGLEPGTL